MTKSRKLCKYQVQIVQEMVLNKIEISYVFADALLFNDEVRKKHIGSILHLTCEALIKYMASLSDRLDQNTNDLIQMYEECFDTIEQVTDERDRGRKFEVLLSYIKKFTVLSHKNEIELLVGEVSEAIDDVKTEIKIHEALENGTYKRTA